MTEAELLTLIHGGENICVEFKSPPMILQKMYMTRSVLSPIVTEERLS